MAGYDLSTDRLYGHIVTRKGRTEFLAFARYLRSLHPAHVRIAIVMDNYSPHLSTKVDTRVGDWAQANNVEIAYVSFYGSWLNRIEPQFTALRYFALDGTDHSSHHEQASMIRRYIAWRNSHLTDPSYAKSSAEPAPSNGQRLPDAVLARLPSRAALEYGVLEVGKQPGADHEADAPRGLQREAATTALHDVDRQMGVLPVLELRLRHPHRYVRGEALDAEVCEVYVGVPGDQLAEWETHRRGPVAAAAGLVEHQRPVFRGEAAQ
jgi:transposase